MWLDGTPYWNGVQMDETGLPIPLVGLAQREGAIDESELELLRPMVRLAAAFIARSGPVTQQDRWEEDPGYSPFTLAVEVAALLCAADLFEAHEPAVATYLRETADIWNAAIERWTYATGTRSSPERSASMATTSGSRRQKRQMAHHPPKGSSRSRTGPDGRAESGSGHADDQPRRSRSRAIRTASAADDPRIVNTVKAIDAILKLDTPGGPLWRRYNGDGYGEHEDGRPFDGTGRGRPWPLLTAERAHYELAAGRRPETEALRDALASFASEGGLLSEQVWDSADIPERELAFGKPSGSAMPLVWAHAGVREALPFSRRQPRLRHSATAHRALPLPGDRIAIRALAVSTHKCPDD